VLLAEPLQKAGFETAAFVGAIVLDRHYGLDQGFDHYDDEMADRNAVGEFGFAERRGGEVVDRAIDWAIASSGRFFLWVHLYDPHASYDAPTAFARRWPGAPYEAEIAYADAQVEPPVAIDVRDRDPRSVRPHLVLGHRFAGQEVLERHTRPITGDRRKPGLTRRLDRQRPPARPARLGPRGGLVGGLEARRRTPGHQKASEYDPGHHPATTPVERFRHG
jgi:hypothetical protein